MVRRVAFLSLVLAAAMLTGLAAPAECGIGAGVHYLKTVGDIKNTPGFDENALGLIGSYQYGVSLVRLEGDLEWINNFGGSDHSMIQPQAYALVGRGLYAGVGIGIGYIDNSWQDAPFYALRAGYTIPLVKLSLDAFGSYQFQNATTLQGLTSEDLDAVTFGVIARF
jgi:hypothetical protein